MTPYGYPPQQPPFVGHCLHCRQPVHGQYVAFPTGPMHPPCAQAATATPRPASKGPPGWAVALGGVLLLGMFGVVALALAGAKPKPKAMTPIAEADAQETSREPRALCAKLRDALGEGECIATASGVGLSVQGTTMVPQCVTEAQYRKVEPKRREKELAFVGSEANWCFVVIMDLRGGAVPEKLITKTRTAVARF